MDKALILGGSHRDIPLIEELKKDFFVITLGNKDYYLGHRFANKYYTIDFNDLDRVRSIIKKEKVDAVIAGCGEESLKNAAILANEMGLGIYDDKEVIELVHDKWRFKQLCQKLGISVPRGGMTYDELDFPFVVKPRTLSGGRGIKIVRNHEELQKIITKDCKNIFFEEYIEGAVIAYSVIIKNQKVIYDFIAKDEPSFNPYLVSTAYSFVLDKNIHTNLKNDVEKIALALNFQDGPFHLQVLLTERGYYFMDVTRRIAGDLFPYLIEYADEVNYTQMVINAYLGKDFNVHQGKKHYAIRHCVMPKCNGIFEGVRCNLKYVLRLDLVKKGEKIKDYMRTHTNIFIMRYDNYEQMLQKAKDIQNYIYAKVRKI